jgi:peptide-methionine (R)-S-oxide reductase
MSDKIEKSETEWREQLSPEQFEVLRRQGTERPFSGRYADCKTAGIYVCAGCGAPLFSSRHKYDSGSGWPSYWQPLDEAAIGTTEDHAHGMRRTEVHCARCGGHLGHVFPDGPPPTGLRYCINSLALDLEPASQESPDD